MSYNTNDGYGAIDRYTELVKSLLKFQDNKVFYISPYGYERYKNNNFIHLGYKKLNFKPNFIYAWLSVAIIFIKNITIIKKIDKCILFSGSNSFAFAFLKNFFKYELIYSVRVNIILNGKIDNSLKRFNIFKSFAFYIQQKFLFNLENYIVKNSDKIVFQSKINYHEYKQMYSIDRKKVFILNNNCNPMWIGRKKKLKLNPGFNIGFIGNLHLNKGVNVILEALKAIKNKKPSLYFTIIGDGPDKHIFQRNAEKLGLKNVYFLGQKKKAYEYMSNFDLIIVPSFMEAFPNVILEALYYEIPILASNVGGIPLILNKNFLFKAGDYRVLSKKIINMLDKDEYSKNLISLKKIKQKFLFNWGNEFHKIIQI